MKRTNSIHKSYTGTSSAVLVLPADSNRTSLQFHSVIGDCEVVIGDNTFSTNTIKIPETVQWEPSQVLTGNIWYRGAGTKLSIISDVAIEEINVPIGSPPSGNWIVDASGNYITDALGEFLYG